MKGVGPVRAALFERLGVRTVGELVELFPFRYQHRPRSQGIGSLQLGQTATVVGEIRRLRARGRFGQQTVNAEVVDATGVCRVRWFNSPYLVDRLTNGEIVRLTGKIDHYGRFASLTNPVTAVIDRSQGDPLANEKDEYVPLYPATEGLDSRAIARAIRLVLEPAAGQILEFLPDPLRAARQLPPRRTAILRIHMPVDRSDAEIARRRLAYEELLLFQLAVQRARIRQAQGPAAKSIVVTEKTDQRIRRRLPFALTAGQERAVAEIRSDLAQTTAMNRMLQGDVGAGKTAVAIYAALATVAAKAQVVLLAPTEVLARQHRDKIEQYLRGSRVQIGFLTGSTSRRERGLLLRALTRGEIDWLIGTHAVLEPDVSFRDLALAIVDEQHKFGVAQRAALRKKGAATHTLVLSATPIPRSLAMTLFGDLDISTIPDRPPGRQPIVTRVVSPDKAAQAWEFARKRLRAGEQAYVVYPLVNESESLPLKAATAEVQRLSRAELAGVELALLHGRMSPAEKSDIMIRFRSGELKALVATTVIEVGVDVPNATMILIQHADRYGLSQLHQLRGRVGRGDRKSFCFLFAEPTREGSADRLSILCRTDDGFRIAEEDLRLRGPGELLGTRQHGVPAFRIADIVADFPLLQQAREDAAELLRDDPALQCSEHTALRAAVRDRYGRMLRMIRVG